MDAYFSNPSALWWGLLAAPLLALFMLKHRPRRRRVPSTLLWKSVSEMQIADAPFSRLRRSMSLLLNLAVLVCGVLALAGARLPGGRERGLPVAIVLDRTAGMRAQTPDGTRIELAREVARRVISSAGDSTFTLLGWDGALLPLAPRDAEADVALRAVGAVDASSRGAGEGPLVDELRRMSERGRRVVLISDHRPRDLSDRVLWLPAGVASANTGFVTAGITDLADGQGELFFALESHGGPPVAGVVLERVLPNGRLELVDALDVAIGEGERATATFRVSLEGLYRARLNRADSLADDNFAYVRFSRREALAVRFEGEPPASLLRLMDALGLKRAADTDADAAYIFTRAGAARPRLPAAYLYPAAPAGVEFGPARDESAVAARPSGGTLWAGAGVPDIRLLRAAPVLTDQYTQPVLDAGEGSVIALVTRGHGALSDLVVGFSMDREAGLFSESAAFVVFWSNWFEHVGALREALPRGAVSVADAVSVQALAGRGEFRYGLLREEGGDLRAGAPGEVLDLSEPGVYRFEALADTRLPMLGVSLLDAEETNTALAPAERPAWEDLRARLRELGAGAVRADIELQPWLALLALAALASDWLLFRRSYRRQQPAEPVKPLPGGATARRKQTGRV